MSILLQMYSWTHNATCFRYGCIKTKYQFNFLWPVIPDLYINDKKFIYIWKNNVWVNIWNFAYASILLSNHNITKFYWIKKNTALSFYLHGGHKVEAPVPKKLN